VLSFHFTIGKGSDLAGSRPLGGTRGFLLDGNDVDFRTIRSNGARADTGRGDACHGKVIENLWGVASNVLPQRIFGMGRRTTIRAEQQGYFEIQ
jgi:hypothetical protein